MPDRDRIVQVVGEWTAKHDLGRLISLMPKTDRPKLSVTEQRRLTAYAAEARYPGYFEEICTGYRKRTDETVRAPIREP